MISKKANHYAIIVLVLVVTVGLVFGTYKIMEPKNQSISSTISPQEAITMLNDDNVVLIDIRTAEEYVAGYIEGAKNIDFYSSNFIQEISKLDKNKKYLIYCRSGSRTNIALNMFEDLGLEAQDIRGGILAWQSQRLPLTSD